MKQKSDEMRKRLVQMWPVKNQPSRSGLRWLKRKLFWISSVLVIVLTVYLAWDYRGPLEISLRSDKAFGLPCFRAKDLLVQGHDFLWATRGMVVYRLWKGESKFVRQYHIPTGFSIF
ncbi:MAG: hypothetical protein IMF11_01065 [Proteobacteria bacterium]|nr:hypothetical protein [Pseudomonadota bacterium]